MSIPPKFLSKILIGWRARSRPIFQSLFRIILQYSDFNFYVATTKNNKFDFGHYLVLVHYIAIQLSESLNFLREIFFIVKQKFLDCQFLRKTSEFQKRRGSLFLACFSVRKKNSQVICCIKKNDSTFVFNQNLGNKQK